MTEKRGCARLNNWEVGKKRSEGKAGNVYAPEEKTQRGLGQGGRGCLTWGETVETGVHKCQIRLCVVPDSKKR